MDLLLKDRMLGEGAGTRHNQSLNGHMEISVHAWILIHQSDLNSYFCVTYGHLKPYAPSAYKFESNSNSC